MTKLALSCAVAISALSSASGSFIASGAVTHPEQQCIPMSAIYSSGEDLCNNMFGTSFKYVPSTDDAHDLAYTMWFNGFDNPNDQVTQNRVEQGKHDVNYTDFSQCHLDSFHKKIASPQQDLEECRPWKDSSCCLSTLDPHYDGNLVPMNGVNLNRLYGDEWRWDKCGRLSPRCERFFVEEACFYQCDPHAGLFRKYHKNSTHENAYWEIFQMPIRGAYCDSWFDACKNDVFCGSHEEFFSCPAFDPNGGEKAGQNTEDEKLSTGAIVGFSILGAVVFFLCCAAGCMIKRERAGKPLFAKFEDQAPSEPLEQDRAGQTATGSSVSRV